MRDHSVRVRACAAIVALVATACSGQPADVADAAGGRDVRALDASERDEEGGGATTQDPRRDAAALDASDGGESDASDAGELVDDGLASAARLVPPDTTGVMSTTLTLGVLEALPPRVFGFNANISNGPAWSATAMGGAMSFLAQARGLSPQLLRYPGGTVGNYFHWRSGYAYVGSGLPRTNTNTLAEFAAALASFSAARRPEPVFQLNMLTADTSGSTLVLCQNATAGANPTSACLSDQRAMLEQAEALGMPVRWIELGNEFYLSSDDGLNVARFATGREYGREAARWIRALRARFTQARIAVVGEDASNTSNTRRDQWNADVRAGLADEGVTPDGYVVHAYAGAGLRAVPGYETADQNNAALMWAAFGENKGVDAVLSMPFANDLAFASNVLAEVPSGARVWFTEYNLLENAQAVAGSWAHAMYLTLQSGLAIARARGPSARVELAMPHNLSGEARFTMIFRSANAFNGAVTSPGPTVPFEYSASGRAMSLVGAAVAGARWAGPAAFSTNPTRTVGSRSFPTLSAWHFRGGSRPTLLIVNTGPGAFEIDTRAFAPFAHATVLRADPRVLVNEPGDITTDAGRIDATVVVPRYGVALLQSLEVFSQPDPRIPPQE